MAKGLVNESSLNSIAEAINVLNGTEGTYMPSEMGEAIIDAIPTQTASGNPINITDAAAYPAKSVVTTLEPVQDLHGYDKPWPAGGGKNLLNFNKETQTIRGVTLTNNNGVLTLNGTNDGTGNSDFVVGTYASATTIIPSGTYKCIISDIEKNVTMLIGFDSATLGNTATSSTITAANGISAVIVRVASGVSVNNVIVKPMITTDASMTYATFEPYSNICPIIGHTGVELTRTGKNLFDPNSSENEWVSKSNEIGHVQQSKSMRIPTKEGDTITLSNGTPSSGSNVLLIAFLDGNDTVLSRSVIISGETYLTKTAPSGTVSAIVAFYQWQEVTNAQLELGSTATAYEPYRGEPHSITFPQAQSPVYGGEVDWTNGVLRVTNVNIASYNGETLPSVWISDRDVYAEGSTPTIGAQVVYELATPLEIPLTPEVITLLKGENNVWTDEGTSEIEYKVDLQSYIQKLIDEASTTASLTSVSPLSLGKSAVLTSTDGEDEIEEVDEPVLYDEVKVSDYVASEDEAEVEPTEKEPDTLEKEGGDTV